MTAPIISRASYTAQALNYLPEKVSGIARRVSGYVQNNYELIEATAIFYGLFHVTSSLACTAGWYTGLPVIALAVINDRFISEKFPAISDRYITPIVDMENIDKAWILAASAASIFILGNPVIFGMALGFVAGQTVHTAIQQNIYPLFD